MSRNMSSFKKFKSRPRTAVRFSTEDLVKTGSLPGEEKEYPLVLSPNTDNVNLISWAGNNQEFIETRLLAHGALLFRGFGLDGAEKFREFASTVSPEQLDYKERAAPRHEVSKKVYTSTEFPADQIIPMHHEMSYSHNWPTKIFFFCDVAPKSGGRTPITDDRKLIDHIDPAVKEEFLAKKVMYVRNYGEGVDLSWQEAFQTEDRGEVEAYCAKAGASVEWKGENFLRTRTVRQVLATHPKTGDTVWFNHAHMFHSSNLEPAVREALLSEFAPEEMPRNAFYGDGTAIADEVLGGIRQLYEDQAVRFAWQPGDVLMVDNFLSSHGRESFEGPRRILVSMAELYTCPDL